MTFFDFEGIVHQEFVPPGQACCKHLEEWHNQAWLVHHAIVSAHNGCDCLVFKIKLQLWEFHCNDVPEIQEHMLTFLCKLQITSSSIGRNTGPLARTQNGTTVTSSEGRYVFPYWFSMETRIQHFV